LKPLTLGVTGWKKLFEKILGVWVPHIKNTQIPSLASGIGGVKTLVNVGSGVMDLVLTPVAQFNNDGRIMKGLSKGTTSFLKTTTIETVKVSTRLAAATATALESAQGYFMDGFSEEDLSTNSKHASRFSEQPKDVGEGLVLGYKSVNEGFRQAQRALKKENSVPIAMIKPIIGLADGLAKTLIGLQNTLDGTQQKRSEDKYKQ
jgi:autophagy-related protein 2